jgi:DNA-binding IclR family transcriptional regulator
VNSVRDYEQFAPTVPAVERAIRVLRALGDGGGRRLSELSRDLGVSKSTLSGLLATLERFDLVERDAGSRTFRLGLGLLDLSQPVLARLDVRVIAHPELARLRDLSGETAILHVPDGEGSLIADRAEPDCELKVVAPVGRRLPPFAGSVAKALLGALPEADAAALVRARPLPAFTPRSITDPSRYLRELDRVRRDGFALEDEEYLPGVRAASAAVRDRSERPVGTLSVVGVALRLPARSMPGLAEEVASSAAILSRRLGAPEVRA